jgi:hypothetical protein
VCLCVSVSACLLFAVPGEYRVLCTRLLTSFHFWLLSCWFSSFLSFIRSTRKTSSVERAIAQSARDADEACVRAGIDPFGASFLGAVQGTPQNGVGSACLCVCVCVCVCAYVCVIVFVYMCCLCVVCVCMNDQTDDRSVFFCMCMCVCNLFFV